MTGSALSTAAGILLETDVAWLGEKGYRWALSSDGNGGGLLVIEGYRLAPGRYDQPLVDLLIKIPRGYNDAPLDMWWVHPTIHLAGGALPQSAEVHEDILGRRWQRFSRHLNSTPWKPGLDDLARFMIIVGRELQ